MLGLSAAHSVSYSYNACTKLSIGKAEVFICFLPKNLFFASPIHPFRASGTFRIVFRRKTILLELELVSYPFLSSYPVLASYLMGVLQHTSPLNVLVCCNTQVLWFMLCATTYKLLVSFWPVSFPLFIGIGLYFIIWDRFWPVFASVFPLIKQAPSDLEVAFKLGMLFIGYTSDLSREALIR